MPGEQYEEEGYAAYDDHDGDLTKKVESSINGDMVRYRVMDEAGNITVRFRRIPYADRSLLNDQEEWDLIRRGAGSQSDKDVKDQKASKSSERSEQSGAASSSEDGTRSESK